VRFGEKVGQPEIAPLGVEPGDAGAELAREANDRRKKSFVN
jgi:hypothetical protein